MLKNVSYRKTVMFFSFSALHNNDVFKGIVKNVFLCKVMLQIKAG